MGKKRHVDWTCVRQLLCCMEGGGGGACAYTKFFLGAGWNMCMCVVECDDGQPEMNRFVICCCGLFIVSVIELFSFGRVEMDVPLFSPP